MSRPLQAGDICLIVGGVSSTRNTGKSCTLKQLLHHGQVIEYHAFGYESFVNNNGESAWFVESRELVTSLPNDDRPIHGFCLALPKHLMRIDGNPDEVSLKQQEPEAVRG